MLLTQHSATLLQGLAVIRLGLDELDLGFELGAHAHDGVERERMLLSEHTTARLQGALLERVCGLVQAHIAVPVGQRLPEPGIEERLLLEPLVDRSHRGLEDRPVDQCRGGIRGVHPRPALAELIREAVEDYLAVARPEAGAQALRKAFGIWRDRKETGKDYVDRIRKEWS